MEGKITKKDELKAISWFIHAGNHDYIPSMYNVAMMLYHGTEDGFVHSNKVGAI